MEKIIEYNDFKIMQYGVLDSTNFEAERIIKNNYYTTSLNNPIIISAMKQSNSKGTNNRSWHSPVGGLWFSIVFDNNYFFSETDDNYDDSLLPIFSLAIIDSFKNDKIHIGIKWYNDLIIENKKFGGLMLTKIFRANKIHTVVGIGINTNNIVYDQSKMISFFELTGKKLDNFEILKNIIDNSKYFLENINSRVKLKIYKRYLMNNISIGEKFKIKNETCILESINKDYSANFLDYNMTKVRYCPHEI